MIADTLDAMLVSSWLWWKPRRRTDRAVRTRPCYAAEQRCRPRVLRLI